MGFHVCNYLHSRAVIIVHRSCPYIPCALHHRTVVHLSPSDRSRLTRAIPPTSAFSHWWSIYPFHYDWPSYFSSSSTSLFLLCILSYHLSPSCLAMMNGFYHTHMIPSSVSLYMPPCVFAVLLIQRLQRQSTYAVSAVWFNIGSSMP